GYTTPTVGKATTAEGILGRIYLGAKPTDPKLQPAYATLSKFGPDKNNSYFRFFGTQAIFYRGGEAWKEWNVDVRDYLVEQQVREAGPDKGSWSMPKDQFAANVGRVYQTALAVLTLEVYYRYPPTDVAK